MAGGERRAELAATKDPRALHTRASLLEAFARLVGEGAAGISVTAVCRAAGVGRSTFYTHFRDMDEVMVASLADTIALGAAWDLERRRGGDADVAGMTARGLTGTVMRLQALRPVVAYAQSSGSRAALEAGLVEAVAADMLPAIEVAAAVEESTARLRADFLAAGLVRVVLRSLEADAKHGPTPERLVEELMGLFPAWVLAEPPATSAAQGGATD